MSNVETDREAFNLANKFLLNWEYIEGKRISTELLAPYEASSRSDTLEKLFKRLLDSASNSKMMPKVVVQSMGGIPNLGRILRGFNPELVAVKYGDDYNLLLEDISSKFPILNTRENFRNERGLWVKFCKATLSGARFLQQFKSAEEFYEWADRFDRDEMTRASLALLLGQEIYGIGFALACDFLKEIGYTEYAKPDSQLRGIFEELKLCAEDDNDYKLFRAIVRVARNAQVTPYKADKWFWLIGSGNFYLNKEWGKDGRLGGRAKDFVPRAKRQLNA